MNVIRWQPPWPMIQISEHEWIVIRDDPRRPAAVVRELPDKLDGGRFRIVRWAPRSEDRALFEYLPTLEFADMAVTFIERAPMSAPNALTAERSPEWGRFERWFWGQASEALVRDTAPAWVHRERLVRQ